MSMALVVHSLLLSMGCDIYIKNVLDIFLWYLFEKETHVQFWTGWLNFRNGESFMYSEIEDTISVLYISFESFEKRYWIIENCNLEL